MQFSKAFYISQLTNTAGNKAGKSSVKCPSSALPIVYHVLYDCCETPPLVKHTVTCAGKH